MRTVDPVRHEERRQDILDAAKRCFARDGLRGASVSGICAEAGISPGHLYHYFASKEAILGAIARMILHAVTERFGRTMESANAVAALITDAQHAKTRDGDGENPLVFDMLAEAGRNPALAQVLQEHGRVDPSLDAGMAASLLIGVVDGFKATAVRDPSLDRAGMAELLRTLIARFLALPAPDADKNRYPAHK